MIIGISKDRYCSKKEAHDCLDGRKARKYGKKATCWEIVDFTTSKELLDYSRFGHTCCGIFNLERKPCWSKKDLKHIEYRDIPKEYPYVDYDGKEYLRGRFRDELAYRGTYVVFIDIDGMINCNDIRRVIYLLNCHNLCPSFYYTTASDTIDSRRFRLAYIFTEIISPEKYEYDRISQRIGHEITRILCANGITPTVDKKSYNPIQVYFGNYGCNEYEDFNVYYSDKTPFLKDNHYSPICKDKSLIWDMGLTGFLINNWNNPRNYENILDYKRSIGDYSMIEYRYFTQSNSTGKKRFIDGIEIYEFNQDIPNKLRPISMVGYNGDFIKLKDGMKRRYTIKTRVKLRRLMKPHVNHNELLYNMVVDLSLGCEYNDLNSRSTLDDWREYIEKVMDISYEDLLEEWNEYLYDEECIREFSFVNKSNCNNVKIAKLLRWEKIVRIFDFTKTNKYNQKRLSMFGYEFSPDTIERIVNENRDKLPNDDYFKSLVNPNLSVRENYNKLKKDNYRVTRDTIERIKRELKNR